jgi:hypothetical protein
MQDVSWSRDYPMTNHRQFEARKTNGNDCKVCHNAKGIWRDCEQINFWVCDWCFAEVIESRKAS